MSEPQKPKKEMLSVRQEGLKTKVSINYSSLSVIQTCMRKAQYNLDMELRADNPSNAIVFGSAIHKALEIWYLSDVGERHIPVNLKEKAQLEAFGHPQGDHPCFRAIRGFRAEAKQLWNTPDDDKRSLANGAKILAEYFRRYKDDGLTVVCDSQGPIVEREMRFPLFQSPELEIEYFGIVDAILENKQTSIVAITDHKTTSQLGTTFFNRLKPNHQYTGYTMGAKRCLGIETDLFMINAVGVYKTKQDFARQFTDRTEEDFEGLKSAVLDGVRRYLQAKKTEIWPQSSPDPCTNWGGCQYLRVCEVPRKLRENVIAATWGKK